MIQKAYFKKACPECDSTNLKIDRERGETICQGCGLVVEGQMVDFDKEWRNYDEDGKEKAARAGPPLTYTRCDMLRTQIGNNSDLQKIKQKDKFLRMIKWQYRSTSTERNLRLALAQLKQVSSFLELPGFVEEEAARIYTIIANKGLVRGRTIERMMIGALYASFKEYGIPRTLNELTITSGYKKKEIIKSYKIISRALSLRSSPIEPVIFIARFANELKITPKTESLTLDILKEAKEKGLLNGKIPIGTAAASLYIASLMNNEKKTQKDIAKVANVTEATIRQRYFELAKKLDLREKLNEGKMRKSSGRKPISEEE